MPTYTRSMPAAISHLIEELNKLPGVGPKSAQRLAYHLLRSSREEAEALATAIQSAKREIRTCVECFNFAEAERCPLCADETRDPTLLCVVEQPLDVLAIERVSGFRGRYHVLHGVLNPMDGVGPEEVRIPQLAERVRRDGVTEVIMATNPRLEGEATAMYVQRVLGANGVRVTRLARGLPSGADLEYADDVTLSRAFDGRQEV
jgi:recombination protein RecR